MKLNKGFYLWVLVLFLLTAGMLFAQEADTNMPPFLIALLSEQFVASVGVIIAATKLVRNAIGGVKGWMAVAVTFGVSIVYSLVQFRGSGFLFAVGVGLAAFVCSAGIFKGSKWIGKLAKWFSNTGIFKT